MLRVFYNWQQMGRQGKGTGYQASMGTAACWQLEWVLTSCRKWGLSSTVRRKWIVLTGSLEEHPKNLAEECSCSQLLAFSCDTLIRTPTMECLTFDPIMSRCLKL